MEERGRYITLMVIEQQMELENTHGTLCFDTNTHTHPCMCTYLFTCDKYTQTKPGKDKMLLVYGDEISPLKINTQPRSTHVKERGSLSFADQWIKRCRSATDGSFLVRIRKCHNADPGRCCLFLTCPFEVPHERWHAYWPQ